jgi:hypothetical protein
MKHLGNSVRDVTPKRPNFKARGQAVKMLEVDVPPFRWISVSFAFIHGKPVYQYYHIVNDFFWWRFNRKRLLSPDHFFPVCRLSGLSRFGVLDWLEMIQHPPLLAKKRKTEERSERAALAFSVSIHNKKQFQKQIDPRPTPRMHKRC